MKYLLSFVLASIFLVSSVSAMSIDFYYSPTCPHCQNVEPTITSLMKYFSSPYYVWSLNDVSTGKFAIESIPFIKIKTNDCRNIEISGDTPILERLPCELQEKSTPTCKTYAAESNHAGSWFVEKS